MTKDRNALRAGIFIVISIAIILTIVVSIRGLEQLFQSSATRIAAFELSADIGGLRQGDEVRVGGVKQGMIDRIELSGQSTAETEDDQILVTFSLPELIILREGASLQVQSTLTGQSWLNIDYLGQGKALAGDVIIHGSAGTISTLVASASEIVPDLRATMSSIRSNTLPKIDQTLHSTTQAVAEANETLAEVREAVRESRADLQKAIANISATTGNLREKLPGILDQFDSTMKQASTTLSEAGKAMDDIKATAANARQASGSARDLLVTNRSRIDDIIVSLKGASDNVKSATAEIRRAPWRLLYKPRKGEIENLTVFESTRRFAEGASDLNDAAAALRDALENPSIDQAKIQPLMENLDKSFQQFEKIEQELWKGVEIP